MLKVKARAIILREIGGEPHVLAIQMQDCDHYYILPGGTHEDGETLSETLVRECKEEICADIRVKDLFCVREFIPEKLSKTFGDVAGRHLLEHYFTAEILNEPTLTTAEGENKAFKSVEWLPLKNIQEYNLLPIFIKEKLNDIWAEEKSQNTKQRKTYMGFVP